LSHPAEGGARGRESCGALDGESDGDIVSTYVVTEPAISLTITTKVLLRGSVWSVGAYAVSQSIRMASSVVLSRLLSPELFGAFLIINTIRTGFILLSDFGIGQNIIYSPNSTSPEYYNTAWTLEIIRSFVLWFVCLLAAGPISRYFHYEFLSYALPAAAFGIIIAGFSSPSRFLLQKAMRLRELSKFETLMSLLGALTMIATAYVTRTVWALIVGGLIASAISAIGTFFLMPNIRYRLLLSKSVVLEIIRFGKWITLSSILYFLAMNFDRLYLSRLVPLELLGVYGIARTVSDLVNLVVLRINNSVLFPFVSSHAKTARTELFDALKGMRYKFLSVTGLGFALLISISDFLIKMVYDNRYQDAAWMLTILLTGAWFTTLASVNESMLLGFGKPMYNFASSGLKLAFLIMTIDTSFYSFGVIGLISTIAVSEFFRYIPTTVGLSRERFSFVRQDLFLTLGVAIFIFLCEGLRWSCGFGTSLDSIMLSH
jgi:O-antigen/teichoic acid export membrane protein